jgi:hypothetical protein
VNKRHGGGGHGGNVPSGGEKGEGVRGFRLWVMSRLGVGVEKAGRTGQGFEMKLGERFFDVSGEIRVWGRYEASIRTWMHSTALRVESGGWWILDPIVLAGAEWREWMEALTVDGGVRGYVITNGNHERDLGRWRQRFEAAVFAHREAASELGCGVDEALEVGRVLAGGYEVVGMRGGGAGEVALLREGVSVHFGDGLLNLEETGFAFLPEKYCSDASELRRSVSRLSGCSANVATFAHGSPLWGDVGQRMRVLSAG